MATDLQKIADKKDIQKCENTNARTDVLKVEKVEH